MRITPIQTEILANVGFSLLETIEKYLPTLAERSVLAITSKVVSISESRVAAETTPKESLVQQEADWFLPSTQNRYQVALTITQGVLAPSAGIDSSNGNGQFVLWPTNPAHSAAQILQFLRDRFEHKELGVVITDSHTSPLRQGTTGFSLAHAGFQGLNPYIGKRDLFGRPFQHTQANIADSLAVAAVTIMGEGGECTPLAVMTELPFVEFLRPGESSNELKISPEDDLYSQLLLNAPWKKQDIN